MHDYSSETNTLYFSHFALQYGATDMNEVLSSRKRTRLLAEQQLRLFLGSISDTDVLGRILSACDSTELVNRIGEGG